MVILCGQSSAQYYDTLYIEYIPQDEVFFYCESDEDFLGVIVYGEENCESSWFHMNCGGINIDEQNVSYVIINKESMS